MSTITIDGKEYEFSVEDITNKEAMQVERVTGVTFAEFGDLLKRGSALGISALAWTIMRREQPTLKFDDVDFVLSGMSMDEDEVKVEPANPTEPASDAPE